METCKSQDSVVNDVIYTPNKVDVETTINALDLKYEFESDCKLKMLGSNLSNDSPIVLYLGEDGENLWHGLQQTGTRLIYFPTMPSLKSSTELYQLVEKAASFVFDYSINSNVYFVGHGIGALLAAKLLADRELLVKNSRASRLQAAFLVSGIYNSTEESDPTQTSWLSFNDAEDMKIAIAGMNNVSPLFDNFTHLLRPGVRLYVFSAGNDIPQLKAQSRQMFDRLADCCDQDDLHFEIKEKVDGAHLLQDMCKPNSFLGRLIRYDICLSQTR